MEIIIKIISIVLIVGVLVSPILLLRHIYTSNITYKFMTYLTIGLIVIAINAILLGWWSDESNIILLKHYDAYYINPDSNSYQVYYDKVLPNNKERVKNLDKCLMGVGWPLKSIVFFFVSTFYLLFLYVCKDLISKKSEI